MESIASWVAPIATTIAALMTASNLGNRVTGTGFIVFTVGSIAWFALGIATGQSNLVWQNAVLTLLNLLGVWRWLGREARIEDGGRTAQDKSAAAASETLFPVSLLGRAVLNDHTGGKLGTLVDAMAGSTSGGLRYLVVASGGVGGVGERFHRLDWNEVTIDGEAARTDLNAAALAERPELAKDDWPGR